MHCSIVYLCMCNTMHYYNRLLLSLLSYRCQLQCQDSRGHVVPACGVASQNSLSGHTCIPNTCVVISLVYLFALFLIIKRMVLRISLSMVVLNSRDQQGNVWLP